jgi:hypothetical protein
MTTMHRAAGHGKCGARSKVWWRFITMVSALFAMAAANAPLAAQSGTLVVLVRTASEREPLVNAEIIDRTRGTRTFTRERGDARVRLPATGALELRIRQLGFAFADRTIERAALRGDGGDTLVVNLVRVALSLPTVAITEARDCPVLPREQTPLAFWALSQLREGAERYASFREAYPFRVRTERRTSKKQSTARRLRPPRETRADERTDSDRWGDRYRPGDVVRTGTWGGFSAQILFVETLGDPAFWAHHCITDVTSSGEPGRALVQLSFAPGPAVRWPDWRGRVTLDSASSVLQRVDFALTPDPRMGPARLEGFSTFREVSPLIVMPDSTAAAWWYERPTDGAAWGEADVVQLVRVLGVDYRRGTPPEQPRTPADSASAPHTPATSPATVP